MLNNTLIGLSLRCMISCAKFKDNFKALTLNQDGEKRNQFDINEYIAE